MTLSTCSGLSEPDHQAIVDDARNGVVEQPLMRAMSLIVTRVPSPFGWIFGNGRERFSGYISAGCAKINHVDNFY